MHRYIHYGNYSPGCKVKAARETTASARSNSRLCKMEGRVGSLPMRRLFTMGILWWEPPMAILLQPAFQYVHTLVFSCNVFPLYYTYMYVQFQRTQAMSVLSRKRNTIALNGYSPVARK